MFYTPFHKFIKFYELMKSFTALPIGTLFHNLSAIRVRLFPESILLQCPDAPVPV